ncbi:MAG: AmmeMemoRadiSam system protein B [Magnetococcales bacterium]|nr:AmmeMemoRadiSam system protein B [Magnetococcales bacterium]
MSPADETKKRTTRQSTLSEAWYPANPDQLAQKVDGMLAAIKPDRIRSPVRVVMTPHASYDYSGSIMAEAFRHIQDYVFRRVIVIGPSLSQKFHGLSLPEVDQFATPLGQIDLDQTVLDDLRQHPLFQNGSTPHEREHSIEILLPFLQRTLGEGWKLVPILTSGMGKKDFMAAAEAIRPWLGAEDLLVISGDLTHYGPSHGYVPFPPDDQVATQLQKLDQGVVDAILTWDPEGLARYAIQTKITASFLAPALLMLHLLHGQSVPLHFRYGTSVTVNKNRENSISYFSGLFMAPVPLSEGQGSRQLSGRDLPTLRTMAEKCLKIAVTQKPDKITVNKMIDVNLLPLSLRQKRGVFVIISKQKKPRCSFSTVRPVKSLYETVLENTIKAVRPAPNFTPVSQEELSSLTLVITTLSPLEAIESPADIELGRHGIAIEKGPMQAAFLPHIATDQGWSAEAFLSNLATMAGLPPEGWQQPDCRVSVFTVQSSS